MVDVTVLLHLGGVNTDLLRHYPDFFANAAKALFEYFPDRIAFQPDTAALTQVYLAISPEVVEKKMSGKYYVPVGEECDTSDFAKDINLQKVRLCGTLVVFVMNVNISTCMCRDCGNSQKNS